MLVASAPLLAASDPKPSVTDLEMHRAGAEIRLSFQLVDAFDDEVRERIDSGLPTGFLYEAKVERQRWWWFNDTIASSRVEVVAMYNALTREYLVNTKQDGKLIDSRNFSSRQEVEVAMSSMHDMPMLELTTMPKGKLTVRVRAELGSRTLLTLFPTTVYTDWTDTESFRLSEAETDE